MGTPLYVILSVKISPLLYARSSVAIRVVVVGFVTGTVVEPLMIADEITNWLRSRNVNVFMPSTRHLTVKVLLPEIVLVDGISSTSRLQFRTSVCSATSHAMHQPERSSRGRPPAANARAAA